MKTTNIFLIKHLEERHKETQHKIFNLCKSCTYKSQCFTKCYELLALENESYDLCDKSIDEQIKLDNFIQFGE